MQISGGSSSLRNYGLNINYFGCICMTSCDNSGVWVVEFEIASIRLGVELDEQLTIELLGDKILIFGNGEKWLIRDFMALQYAKKGTTELNTYNAAD